MVPACSRPNRSTVTASPSSCPGSRRCWVSTWTGCCSRPGEGAARRCQLRAGRPGPAGDHVGRRFPRLPGADPASAHAPGRRRGVWQWPADRSGAGRPYPTPDRSASPPRPPAARRGPQPRPGMVEGLTPALWVPRLRWFGHGARRQWLPAGLVMDDRTRVLSLIEQAIDGRVSLGEIAAVLGLAPCQRARRCRTRFGARPRPGLRRRRSAEARRPPRETEQPLAAIARGFSPQADMTPCSARQIRPSPARHRAQGPNRAQPHGR